MSVLREAVERFFQAENWPYQEADFDHGLMLNFEGKHGTWRCYARIRDKAGQFVFYSFAPLEVPQERYPQVLEFITRANFGMFIGNFEFNFASGTLQYRTSIDVENEEEHLTHGLLRHLVYQNVLIMDKYLPALTAVVDEGLPPEEAIRRAEQ